MPSTLLGYKDQTSLDNALATKDPRLTSSTAKVIDDTTPTISPAVINSKAATEDLNRIKTSVTEANTGILTQAQRLASEKAVADASAKEAEATKKTQDQKDEELRIKSAALEDGTGSEFDTSANEAALKNAEETAFREAENVRNTILRIQNGTVPLSPGEKAQIDGLTLQFNQLIDEQKLINKGASGVANIRGYQTGSAEYDPTFQVKTIGSIVTAGMNKVADLNIKLASAVAEMTQGFKDNKIKSIKDAWDVYSKALEDRQTILTDTIDRTTAALKAARDAKDKAEKEYYDQVTKPIQDIALIARKFNAPTEVVQKMLDAGSYEEALALAGDALVDPKAKYELEAARLDNILKNEQIRKTRAEINQIGQPTASERKQQEADEKAALAVIPELQDKIKNIDTLINHRGLYGAVGPNPLARSSMDFDAFTGVRGDFIAGVEQLVSQDTLDTLLNLKAKGGTLGALSEGEGRMLRSAATKIGTYTLTDDKGKVIGYKASESAFKKELETIKLLTQRALSKAQGSVIDSDEKNSLNSYFNNDSALTPGQFDPAEYY